MKAGLIASISVLIAIMLIILTPFFPLDEIVAAAIAAVFGIMEYSKK